MHVCRALAEFFNNTFFFISEERKKSLPGDASYHVSIFLDLLNPDMKLVFDIESKWD